MNILQINKMAALCLIFFLFSINARIIKAENINDKIESNKVKTELEEASESNHENEMIEENDSADLAIVGSISGDLVDELDLNAVQGMVDRLLERNTFSLRQAIEQVMRGGNIFSREKIRSLIQNGILDRFYQEKDRIQKILVLILFAAIFSNLSAAFDQGQAQEIGFYVVYLLIFTMLMNTFSSVSISLSQVLETVTALMKSLAPAYFLVLAASQGAATAAVFYQGILLLVWCVQWILLNFILPACNLYILLCIINTLSKEEMLSRMAELLKSLITWGLNTMLSVVLGLQVIRSLIAPIMDHLKRSAIGKTASALPGVGNAINSVTELVLSCAVLVRNSLGVVFLLILLLAGISPLIHYAFLTITYRFLSAIAQPISDPRLVRCLGTMGDGCALLMRIFITMEIMCVLTFFILMISFGKSG